MRRRISSDKLLIFSYFIGVIIAGSVLLSLPPSWEGEGSLSALDAVFTATSAVCVTGLIVVDTAQFSRFGQFVIMALIQFGGLGIVTFATIFVATNRRKVSLLNRGMIQELYIDEIDANPRRIVRHIVMLTLAAELIGGLVIGARLRDFGHEAYAFKAAFLAVSAFCNAGFSVFSDSLNGFRADWVMNLTFIALIVIGGLGFVVLRDLGRLFMRTKRRLSYHSLVVLRTTAILIVVAFAAFYLLEYDGAYAGMPIGEKILAALFQAVTPRTAGFDTVPQASLGLPSAALILALMFTGGSPGSTAGGVKTTTVFAAFMAAFRGPEDDGGVVYAGGYLAPQLLTKAFSIIVKGAALAFSCAMALVIFEGPSLGFLDALFEAVSAFGTVGLSLGVTGGLGAASKATLIATMFAGRVGLFAMAVLKPADRIERFAEFPREEIMLG